MTNSKFLKENGIAIITAISCLLLVLYYLLVIIPDNEENTDLYFKTELQETGKRFNEALLDYAGAVADETILEHIQKNQDVKKLADFKDDIVIVSINIKRVKEQEDSILLQRNIVYKSPLYMDSKKNGGLDVVKDTIRLNKNELLVRITGANNFKRYIFYDDVEPKTIFIRSGVNRVMFDSLLNSKRSNRSTAFEFQNYRVYQYSFPISKTNQKVSCFALIDAEVYYKHTREFKQQQIIYFALIVFLLLLSIPLIKPLISSQNEKINQSDVIAVTTTIGMLAIIMAIFFLQYFLNDGRIENQKRLLEESSSEVKKEFTDEFLQIHKVFIRHKDSLSKNTNVVKDSLSLLDDEQNISIQNLFTMKNNGDLVKDFYYNGTRIRKNFKDRNYFESHIQGNASALFSAVYSRNDNRMVMLYTEKVKKKKTDKASVIGIAYHPKFQDSIKLNPNFNYILCNKAGRVYFHSNANKNLNENILANVRNDKNLNAMFRGLLNSHCFTIDYDLKTTLVHASVLAPIELSEPLFLLTYKSLDFEQNLSLFALINSFLITLVYCFVVFFLALLFSVTFYKGHLPPFSKQHLYWLFPNASKKEAFKFLSIANYIFVVISFVAYALFPLGETLFFIAFAGMILTFLSFVKLNINRVNYWPVILVCLSAVLIVVLFYYLFQSPLFALFFALMPMFFYLNSINKIYAKKERSKWDNYFLNLQEMNVPPISNQDGLIFKTAKNRFVAFMTSILVAHYWLIATLIFLFYYYKPIEQEAVYAKLSTEHNNAALIQFDKHQSSSKIDFVIGNNPADEVMMHSNFYNQKAENTKPKIFDFVHANNTCILMLLLVFALCFVMLKLLVKYYSAWFFFADLACFMEHIKEESSLKINKGFYNNQAANPPYSWQLILNFTINEQLKTHQENEFHETMYYSNLLRNTNNLNCLDYPTAIELLMKENIEFYEHEYESIWLSLSTTEQFVLQDFAFDHFVSNKNKFCLAELYKKGLIILDEETYRLRIMTLAFRLYVMEQEIKKESINTPPGQKPLTLNEKGTFAKWKAPILIVAISIVLLLMYLYQQQVDKFIFITGAAISFLGLFNKMTDFIKSKSNT